MALAALGSPSRLDTATSASVSEVQARATARARVAGSELLMSSAAAFLARQASRTLHSAQMANPGIRSVCTPPEGAFRVPSVLRWFQPTRGKRVPREPPRERLAWPTEALAAGQVVGFIEKEE